MLIDLIQFFVYGVVYGSMLALGAAGLSLTFGVLSFANFSHGALCTLGAYLYLVFYTMLRIPVFIAFPLALIGTALVAVLIDKSVYSRLRDTKEGTMSVFVASVGIALILESVLQAVFGPDNYNYSQGIQFAKIISGIRIRPNDVIIFFSSLGIVSLLHFFLSRSKIGKAMRAVADDRELAALSGIPVKRVIMWTWVVSGALAASCGIFIGMQTRIFPQMGANTLLPFFAAAILGGLGNPYGAVIGAFFIGITQEMSVMFIPPTYKSVVAFSLMVLVLVWRPQGIFSGRSVS